MMRPSLSVSTSKIRPSAIRPVFERRAIREASSSVFLRKRSRNDIASLWLQGSCRHGAPDTAFRSLGKFHDDAVAANPVVVGTRDFVFTGKAHYVICK